MSVGLLLRAKLKRTFLGKLTGHQKPDQLLKVMEQWLGDFCQDLRATTYIGQRDTNPTLFCRLHPAAEDLEISFIEDGQLTVSANTSSAGPGYHIFVCDMLHKLGERFRLQWDEPNEEYQDEAGYFHSGDSQKLFAEMSTWIKTIAGWFFDGTLKDKQHAIRLAMPLDVGFTWEATAITPLGPRDENWLRKTAEDGYNGQDFFAWWNPGLNAEYFLRRALVEIWADVRWRAPVNDQERQTLNYVAGSLKTAYELDATLTYPWAEWSEILRYLHRIDDEYAFVHRAGTNQATMGYRRHDVTVQLPGNWWVTVPGSFSDFRPDGNHNYFAVDPPREVWVTSYTFKGDLPALLEAQRAEIRKKESVLVHEAQNYIAWAEIKSRTDEGKEWFTLTSSNVGLGNRAVCTVVFMNPEDREWAIGVWKSLQAPQALPAQ
jgi:hypothetical protein